jgi:hypothetical protein
MRHNLNLRLLESNNQIQMMGAGVGFYAVISARF